MRLYNFHHLILLISENHFSNPTLYEERTLHKLIVIINNNLEYLTSKIYTIQMLVKQSTSTRIKEKLDG